tara:strand:+ start:5131 stop:5715 length:585 start_codon:yes stop_codon:yes gene_type:complete
MNPTLSNPNKLAEDFISYGIWDSAAVDQLSSTELDELFDHLVARSIVETAASSISPNPEVLDSDAQAAVLSLQSFYLGALNRSRASRPDPSSKLPKAATWLAIEPVLRDRDFLIRLAQRGLSGLGARCARDLADLLGVPKQVLEDYFAGQAGENLAFVENRNVGKPQDGGVEDFATALARSDVPDAFKRRWLEA